MKTTILYFLYALFQALTLGINYLYLQSAVKSPDTIAFILILLGAALQLPLYLFFTSKE